MKNLIFLFIAIPAFLCLSCEKKDPREVSVAMKNHTACKDFGLKQRSENDSREDCLIFSYDGSDVLSLRHVNAAFNCCPGKLSVEIKQVADTLIVIESEEEALCDCDCLYDLEYELTGIDPASYVIRVKEPYLREGDMPIELRINLKKETEGSVCETRSSYPWGF